MESEVIKYLAQYGPIGVAFGYLLINTQKQNDKREIRYQETIKENQSIIEKLASTINGEINNMKGKIDYIFDKLK